MEKRLYVISTALLIANLVATFYVCQPAKKENIVMPQEETEMVAQCVKYDCAPIEEEIVDKPASEPQFGFDFEYICRVVAAESRGEPYEGQVAVARCIWNTAIAKSMTLEEVVEMPNRYAKPVSADLVTDELRDACRDAFLGMNLPTEEPIEYFYSTNGGFYSKWHETALEHVITIGNHKFFMEK